MDSASNFSGRSPLDRFYRRQAPKLAMRSPAIKTTCHFGNSESGLALRWNIIQRGKNIYGSKSRRVSPAMVFVGHSNDDSSASPSETVMQFYKCINDGNLTKLGSYISADCHVDERSFPVPFHGKKEVLRFFKELIEGMGESVKFKVDAVCEGDELIAAAKWHLEWKNAEIPFTRGCSFFECRKEKGKTMIKKAQIVIESPVKPGVIVLQLLKMVTNIFDNYPTATTWFLKSHQIILNMLQRIYSIVLAIFIKPILESYFRVWNIANRASGFGFDIILSILKLLK